MEYVDRPDKKQKDFEYARTVHKLDDETFSEKKFQRKRKISTKETLCKSFGRIGMCVNGKSPDSIPVEGLDKVCFVICNTYSRPEYKLGVGPLNDGYMVALAQHHQEAKVFFLHNPNHDEVLRFIGYFLKYTRELLTIYYSGRSATLRNHSNGKSSGNDSAMVLNDGYVFDSELNQLLYEYLNETTRVILIADCCNQSRIWNLHNPLKPKEYLSGQVILITVGIDPQAESKACSKAHGIFTYLLCKNLEMTPRITAKELAERISTHLKRFNEIVITDATVSDLLYDSLYLQQ